MMNSGGDGGLAIKMQMDQYNLINENNPCDTEIEANDIVRELSKTLNASQYGLYPKIRTKYAEFQVTESEGKFYIWMKAVSEDPELPVRIDGWMQITSKGMESLDETQDRINRTFKEIPGYVYKAVCMNDLYYIYCKPLKDPTL